MNKQDTALKKASIIGAGIVGIATGLYLQRDGWKVTVFDPKDPGEGTSKGNAGMFATGQIIPGTMPDLPAKIPSMLMQTNSSLSIRWRYLPTLIPWLIRFIASCNEEQARHSTRALAGLVGDAMDAYEPLFQSAGASDLVRREGLLYVYKTPRMFAEAQLEFALKREHGIRFEVLDKNEIRELVPALAPINSHGVLHPDYAHTVDPFALAQKLGKRLVQAGGIFVKAEATGFEFRDNCIIGVQTADKFNDADIVVVAAGAYSKPFASALGANVPLDTERGYHVTFTESGIDLDIPVLSVDGHFLVTPMTPGLRTAGLVEFAGLNAPSKPGLHARLVNQTKKLLPDLNTKSSSNWMGFRPAMPDSLPVIGRTPNHRNAFFAFGHGHIGLTSAAATGRAIADLAANRTPKFDLKPFRSDRF